MPKGPSLSKGGCEGPLYWLLGLKAGQEPIDTPLAIYAQRAESKGASLSSVPAPKGAVCALRIRGVCHLFLAKQGLPRRGNNEARIAPKGQQRRGPGGHILGNDPFGFLAPSGSVARRQICAPTTWDAHTPQSGRDRLRRSWKRAPKGAPLGKA